MLVKVKLRINQKLLQRKNNMTDTESIIFVNENDLLNLDEYFSVKIGSKGNFFVLIKNTHQYDTFLSEKTLHKSFIQNIGTDISKNLSLRLIQIFENKNLPLPAYVYIEKECVNTTYINYVPDHTPVTKFWFGKYINKTIDEVLEIDKSYLEWVANNFQSPNHKRDIKKKQFIEEIKKKFTKNNKDSKQSTIFEKYVDVLSKTWVQKYSNIDLERLKQGKIKLLTDKTKYKLIRAYAFTFGEEKSIEYQTAFEEFEQILFK